MGTGNVNAGREEKKTKRYRCRDCREWCVRTKDPRSGFKKLFAPIKVGGQVQADINKPHICPGKPKSISEVDVRRIAKEEISTFMGSETPKPVTPAPLPSGRSDVAEVPKPAMVDTQGILRSTQQYVDAKVAAMMKPVVEKVYIIKQPNGAEVEVPKGTFVHPLMPRLLRYIKAGEHVYLYGAPGGGKSHAAKQCSQLLDRPFGYLSLAPMTPESRLMGFINANGTFVDTQFFECYTKGGVFCLDEADNANDALLTALNGALENKVAAFPDGLHEAHENFVMVATGNTAGYGGTRGHAGRRAFDSATRERFAYIPWMYDEKMEEDISVSLFKEIGPWLKWVREVRAYCRTNFPDVVVSPRASIKGAKLLSKGSVESVDELAEAVLFKGLEAATRTRILGAVALPAMEVR